MNLKSITILAQTAGYNDENKRKFKKVSMNFLKSLAEKLELPEGSYDIRYNPGGIAVSGEATLHHENFYFQLGQIPYWRPCKGRKDFVGGANHMLDRYDFSHQKIINDIVRELSLATK
jgi:hypothetical protein